MSNNLYSELDHAKNVVLLAKRLLLTDWGANPDLFSDRLNDLSIAIWEYEQIAGGIKVDLPESQA